MRIVIIGLGTIGQTILKQLACEEHTITIIDEDKDLIENMIEKYDVFGIVGNGACMEIQAEAKVGSADLVIVLTTNDELNVFACLVAKRLGAQNTIARVRNPAYRKQIAAMKDTLGISIVVNPERETANEIFNMISLPSVARMEQFARGKALLVEVVAEQGCRMIGENLISLNKKLNSRFLICAVQRGEQVIIPSGSFTIEQGDKIYFTADAKKLDDFLAEVGMVKSPYRNILIVGGGRVGFYLADMLSGKKKYEVKLIEKDADRVDELAEELPNVTVICGNGTQHDLLIEEGIEAMDAFVALTNVDEENILVSMFANKKRVKKTITQIQNGDLFELVDELGIDNNVSTKYIVANRVISYVRALNNTQGSNVRNLYRLVNNQVEALEFAANTQGPIYNKPLKELRIKKNCLIAAIIRNNDVIIPDGSSDIRLGDSVVVVTTCRNFDDLTDVFE